MRRRVCNCTDPRYNAYIMIIKYNVKYSAFIIFLSDIMNRLLCTFLVNVDLIPDIVKVIFAACQGPGLVTSPPCLALTTTTG